MKRHKVDEEELLLEGEGGVCFLSATDRPFELLTADVGLMPPTSRLRTLLTIGKGHFPVPGRPGARGFYVPCERDTLLSLLQSYRHMRLLTYGAATDRLVLLEAEKDCVTLPESMPVVPVPAAFSEFEGLCDRVVNALFAWPLLVSSLECSSKGGRCEWAASPAFFMLQFGAKPAKMTRRTLHALAAAACAEIESAIDGSGEPSTRIASLAEATSFLESDEMRKTVSDPFWYVRHDKVLALGGDFLMSGVVDVWDEKRNREMIPEREAWALALRDFAQGVFMQHPDLATPLYPVGVERRTTACHVAFEKALCKRGFAVTRWSVSRHAGTPIVFPTWCNRTVGSETRGPVCEATLVVRNV